MNSLKTYVVLPAALAGMVLAAAGCQTSGNRATADTSRPRADVVVTDVQPGRATPAGATMDASMYTQPYIATVNTPYASTPNATTAEGTIRQGERVYFNGTLQANPGGNAWQQARLEDGSIRYVKPAEFRAP